MNWKDALSGATATLAVTIVGGLVVYYATKEPDSKKTDRLEYEIVESGAFTGGSQDVALSSVRITNAGGVASKHVQLVIQAAHSQIKDLAISSAPGQQETSRSLTSSKAQVSFDSILPREELTVNLLLDKPERPTIDLRSDTSAGELKLPAPDTSLLNKAVGLAVPVASFLAILVTLVSIVLRRRLEGRSTNNAGFLLLHSGMYAEAEQVLAAGIRDGECDSYHLSNYAAAKAMNGKVAEAKNLMRSGMYVVRGKRARGVAIFNQAIISLVEGDRDSALQSLSIAVGLTKDVKEYCNLSVIFDAIRLDDRFKKLQSA